MRQFAALMALPMLAGAAMAQAKPDSGNTATGDSPFAHV